MTMPGDKSELMERIERAWQELDQMVGALSDEQLSAPGADGWAIKDHLAHMAVWERSLVALLEGRDRSAAMGLQDAASLDTDELNARIYAQHRGFTAAEARALLGTTHDEVRAALARLSYADLQAPYGRYQPQETGDRKDEPVIGWVAGNTYEHVDEHRTWIADLMQPA